MCSVVCVFSFLYGVFFIFQISLFMTTLGLHSCLRAFSNLSEWGLLSSWGVQASHYDDFFHCGARALGTQASVVVGSGLQSAGSVVVVQGFSCSAACGIFLDQGSNPCLQHWQWILYHWAARETQQVFLTSQSLWFLICKIGIIVLTLIVLLMGELNEIIKSLTKPGT